MSSSQPVVIEIPLEMVALSAAPGLSRSDTCRLYFDGTNLLGSLAGAAYAAIAGGGGGTPSGPAGGDLTGTYPNPTLAAFGPGATGPIGDGTHVPVITIDAKGRVSALTSAAITGAPPSGAAGGDLTGTYPNPTIAANAVTLAKMANLAANSIIGNNTGGAATPLALSASDVRTLLGLVIGTNVEAWSAVLDALASVMSSTATAAAQRTALGLGTAAVQNVDAFCQVANNLSDVTAATARANIGANVYDIGWFVAGKPTASQVVCQFIATRSVVLPQNLTGSQAKAGTASTGTVSFDIQVNGVSKGSITFTASATGTFTFSNAVTLAAADVLTVIAPGSQDATLADVRNTLLGTY